MKEQESGVTRRSLLKLTAAAGVASALPMSQQAFAKNASSANVAGSSHIHYWGAKDFEAYLNSSFNVDAGLGRPLRMKLASVDEFPIQGNKEVGECFALRFRLESGTSVPQGTYTFTHDRLGEAAFLIVPATGQPMEYTAVINHRRSA